ncbi:MAG: substrate-binding domain-containing protein [Halomonas sp.]|uniref:LacI family DNA-binding transcriptional regulator n=1 Tax=Billgrantia tianxiuensis TaxID=2497861 RepID=A0A6I6SSM0_9GAMM|nr:substrate-binding domain-containing protein [Halomonas tianxiuensis]MCE8032229.1 substrate-binding domain-containing protein [Halomonas sp. MCCC 1A11057]MDX5433165.1 substrate-binding domain-containing protein [Halomonas sp.]MDX5502799.1 substrate-binding domain-containing protein [Halomonas sp.]QHC49763.1 LacI family DNA-binding transcriptional regulator [Halomonas tianxiuensis]
MKKKRPTLQDIADRVGATKMTVSRCLRDPSTVSEGLRKRIFAVAEQVGYIPNRAPDLLSRATSHSIGLLVPSLTNQVFADVLVGIEKVTEPLGYHLMLSHYGYSAELEERSLASLLSYNVDGVILSDSHHTARTCRMLETAGIPTVEIMDVLTPPLHQAVGYDNVQAAYDMVSEMIRQGRRRIVYLAVRLDPRTLQREQGYRKAMEEHGLPPLTLQRSQRSSYTVGAALLGEILQEHPETDGIFCTNDDVAVGAYFECLRRGIRVPEQMGIAGFHGHDMGQVMTPRLASVVTPRQAIGERAARELLARIQGQATQDRAIDLGYRIEPGMTL